MTLGFFSSTSIIKSSFLKPEGLTRRLGVDDYLAIGIREVEFTFTFGNAISPQYIAFL